MWFRSMPDGVASGLHAITGDSVTGLRHVGENWTTATMHIDVHTHDGWELYLQLHGRARWRVGDARQLLRPGSLVAVSPGMAHGHDPAGSRWPGNHYLYVAFDPSVFATRRQELAASWNGPLLSTEGLALQPAFRLLIREARLELPYASAAVTAALDLLLIEATRIFTGGPTPAPVPAGAAVQRARTLLDEHLDQPWTVPALASAVGLSASRLAQRFPAEVGLPPHRYLLERRVERCAELLRSTDRTVSEIAREAGFSSATVMARAFRTATASTPSEWRSGRPAR